MPFAVGVQPRQGRLENVREALREPFGEGVDDVVLAGEELVQRAQGNAGPLGDVDDLEGVQNLIFDDRRRRVEDAFDAITAALLAR